eukprot:gb/GECG01007454.1/.p1 GENE.gb/GECG01007454.1/~~gb/GECG01007454.1/.p1  ORF type:complete len:243 (+),score=24.25 gb/GECG01007454.1/:1-729(+)
MIIDECSMLSPTQLFRIERLLWSLKTQTVSSKETDSHYTAQQRFGGCGIVLCGDYLQLPPVAATPLYTASKYRNCTGEKALTYDNFVTKRKKSKNGDGMAELGGLTLYANEFKITVLLVQLVRQQSDTGLQGMLSEVRQGGMSEGNRQLLNARVIPPPAELFAAMTIGVATNKMRKYYSDLHLGNVLQNNPGIEAFLLPARFKITKGQLQQPNPRTRFIEAIKHLKRLEPSRHSPNIKFTPE